MTTKRALKLLKKVLLSILADIRGCEREEEICKMFVLVNFGITEKEYDEIMGV